MSRSYIANSRRGIDPRLLGWAIAATLGLAASQAHAIDAVPQMKYAAPVHFSSADDQRFDLMTDGGAGDDCDTSVATATSYSGDTIVLAKAETDKKSSRASRAVKSDVTLIDAAPVAEPAAIGVAADGTRDWDIVVADKTLNATMARWAASAGWQLLWELPVDYAVEARTRVHGTFEEAVSVVASSMAAAEIPMKAVFYQGNKVLRIMAKGSEQ